MTIPERPAPKAGDVITNPLYGATVRWLQIGSESSPTKAELIVYPQAAGPPAHIHPKADERFEVRSGAIRVKLGREERVVEPGETVTVTPRTTHTWYNHTDQPAMVIVEMDPGYAFAQFIDRWYEMAREGRLNADGDLGLLDTAMVFDASILDTLAFPGIPLGLQKLLFRGIGRLAKLRRPQVAEDR